MDVTKMQPCPIGPLFKAILDVTTYSKRVTRLYIAYTHNSVPSYYKHTK